jgi:DNA polymerase I-like protein with 3'-5' exonuclease and polymerase domains
MLEEAMKLLAEHKLAIYSKRLVYEDSDLKIKKQNFNPNSPDDKHLLLTELLGYESGKLVDSYETYERDLERAQKYNKPEPKEPKNKWSWGIKELEILEKTISDPTQVSLVKALIEFSFGNKIKTSFIPAFYRYTLEGRLYSNLKLLGAKSGRYTSSDP